MAQYHSHVNRLKEAIDEPPQASFASEANNAESTDASEVIANVEAQLVGEAASHAAAAPAETQRPPAAVFHPPVPNSTRSAPCVHLSATCMMPVADRWQQAYKGTGRLASSQDKRLVTSRRELSHGNATACSAFAATATHMLTKKCAAPSSL